MTMGLFGDRDLTPGAPVMTVLPPEGGAIALEGFMYWWLKYVKGFVGTTHCASCLLGAWARDRVNKTMPTNQPVVLDKPAHTYNFLYLCGVRGSGYNRTTRKYVNGYADNFHLPMRPRPGFTAEAVTYNGFRVVVQNAESLLPITPVADGWRGLDRKMTTCRNFQFGVQHYGDASVRDGVNGFTVRR